MTLSEQEIDDLRGIHDEISIDEVIAIYLPLSRLLNFYISSNLRRQAVLEQFLGRNEAKVPYVIGIAGSVSVGKVPPPGYCRRYRAAGRNIAKWI